MKKDEIIKEARQLFQTYGYSKVSMDEIAIKSGVTKKTIYSYFKDKEELFKYFIDEELKLIKEKLDKDIQLLTPIEFISNNIYKMLELRKNSLIFSKLQADIKKNNVKHFLKCYDDEILNYIEEKINDWILKGVIKKCNAHLVSYIIYKVYLAVMLDYDKEIDEFEITKEITSILKDGLFN